MKPENQSLPTEKETEVILRQLFEAEKNHIEWLARLHEHLLCEGSLPQNVCDCDAHHHCQFGRWYYNDLSESIRKRDDFQHMGAVHKQMHAAARQLLVSWQNSHSIELAEYRNFIATQHNLIKLLTELRDSLNVVLMSYDNLTGALRREPFMLLVEKQLLQNKRTNIPFCLVMLDLDFFKKINDGYGHLIGDKVLQQTTHTIANVLRDYDSLCRYGGEEFIILLPDTTQDEAQTIIERVRKNVEAQRVVTDDKSEIHVTISAGIALVDANSDINTNIDHADSALYRAKSEGRNRVCVWKA